MNPTYLGLIHHGSHGAVPGGEDPPPVEEGPTAGLEEPRLVALVGLDALEKNICIVFPVWPKITHISFKVEKKLVLYMNFRVSAGKRDRCEHKESRTLLKAFETKKV